MGTSRFPPTFQNFETAFLLHLNLENQLGMHCKQCRNGEKHLSTRELAYAGMIIGLNTRQDDIEINICKIKNSVISIQLTPILPSTGSANRIFPRTMFDFVEEDELLKLRHSIYVFGKIRASQERSRWSRS